MAYHSSSGAIINQGAAGIGEYFMSLGQFTQARAGGGGIRAYREGSLGEYMLEPSQVDAYRDGVFGDGTDIDQGPLEAYHDGSLGQVAPPPTSLDLKDPQSIKETKSAIGIASGAMAEQYLAKWNEEFYASEIWDERATELWRFFLTNLKTRMPAIVTTYTDQQLTVSTAKGEYPTATGLLIALTTGVGSPAFPGNPNYFATNFPKLSAWMQTVAAAGGQGQVLEPFFSFGETIKGKPGKMKMSTIAWFGLGATALVVGYMFFSKRRPATT